MLRKGDLIKWNVSDAIGVALEDQKGDKILVFWCDYGEASREDARFCRAAKQNGGLK
jgi:hypothetical protein